jgi:putative ABC transport system ATP-binding protein
MIEARRLCKFYRTGAAQVRALDEISLDIAAGSFVLLTGPSGSGKSTLLSLLGGLERPTAGQVLFDHRDLGACADAELARLRRRIGFVFQDFALSAELPVWENVTYPLVPRGQRQRRRYEVAKDWLMRFGLADKATALPGELSGGEQQRVAVVRALIGGPELILADEPTSALDDDSGAAVIGLLEQAHAAGATVVVSSHDPRLHALATRVCGLNAGRLVSDSGVRSKPRLTLP